MGTADMTFQWTQASVRRQLRQAEGAIARHAGFAPDDAMLEAAARAFYADLCMAPEGAEYGYAMQRYMPRWRAMWAQPAHQK